MNVALITGATGQDGYYLSDLLHKKGYEVHAFVRRTSKPHELHPATSRVHHGSMEDYQSILNAVVNAKADEIYHLAAQSFVHESFLDPGTTFNVNIAGTNKLFDAIRTLQKMPKVFFAASSEMYGNSGCPTQDENTPFDPVSPYGISKLAGYHLSEVYRNAYKMPIWCGIMFNHESPRRGIEFVTQKIVTNALKAKQNPLHRFSLGNMYAKRDWGHAKDYVRAMYMMLQTDVPDNYVVATGKQTTIQEFCTKVFDRLKLIYSDYITTDNAYSRPIDLHSLCGNADKINHVIGWKPVYSIDDLIDDMLTVDGLNK